MSVTPRTDTLLIEKNTSEVSWFLISFAQQLERELNAEKQHVTELEGRLRVLWDKLDGERKHYQDRIKRLEEAGDAMESCLEGWAVGSGVIKGWTKAKEAKP